MATSGLYLNKTEVFRFKDSLMKTIFEELTNIAIEKKLSLYEPVINLLADMDIAVNYWPHTEITDFLKTCEDFKAFISILEPVFSRMERQKRVYEGLDEDFIQYKKIIREYAKEHICQDL